MKDAMAVALIAQFGAQAEKAVGLLKSMANECRLLVLCHLAAEGELSLGQLLDRTGLGQSALSQHLAKLRDEGFKLAVVSSSRNCAEVLRAAKIDDLFEARVDGVTLVEMSLPGKPAPDSFIKAAELLGNVLCGELGTVHVIRSYRARDRAASQQRRHRNNRDSRLPCPLNRFSVAG